VNRSAKFILAALRGWLLLAVFFLAAGQFSLNKSNPAEEALSPPCFRMSLPAMASLRFSVGGKPANLLYVGFGLYFLALLAGCRVWPSRSLLVRSALVFVAVSALSWAFSPYRLLSWRTGLSPLLIQAGFFLLAAASFRTGESRKLLLTALAAGLGVSVAGGLALYGRGIHFPQTPDRIWLSFGHPNSSGSVLVVFIPILTALAFFPGPRSRRLAAGLGAGLFSLALFLTYSRTAWLSLLVALVVLGALTLRGRVRAWFFALLAALVLLLVLGVNLGPQKYWKERVKSFATWRQDPNVRRRLIYMEAGLRLIRERPLLGYGPGYGVFMELYRDLGIPDTGEQVTAPHNGFISMGAGIGLAGLASFAALIYGVFLSLKSLRRDPDPWARAFSASLAAGLTGFLLGNLADDPLLNERLAGVIWILWGVLAASAGIDSPPSGAYNTGIKAED